MKVAFWDGNRVCGDVTGVIAAISTFCAIHYEQKVYLGSNHMSNRMLKDYYFSSLVRNGRDRTLDRLFFGEPEYFRQLWEEKRAGTEILTKEGICLLPLPDIQERFMFCHTIQEDALYFMDVSGGMNASVRTALEEADKVVILLSQNIAEIRRFFHLYSSIIPKAIFLFPDYRKKRKGDAAYLRRNYGVSPECVAVIPYCEAYLRAGEEGEVEKFIRANLNIAKEDRNFEFMHGIELASGRILGYQKKEEYGLSE